MRYMTLQEQLNNENSFRIGKNPICSGCVSLTKFSFFLTSNRVTA